MAWCLLVTGGMRTSTELAIILMSLAALSGCGSEEGTDPSDSEMTSDSDPDPAVVASELSADNLYLDGKDLVMSKAYSRDVPLGGGAVVMKGRDFSSGSDKGGAYLVYDGNPAQAHDRGALGLYPLEANKAGSLSICPSGSPAQMLGEDTASLGVQFENGAAESRFVIAAKKWGEARLATLTTGTNPNLMPMTFYVGSMKLLELTQDGRVALFFKGFPALSMTLPYGLVAWHTGQVMQVEPSPAAVKGSSVLNSGGPGTEVSFIDLDGVIKKAIKQTDGRWRRVNDLSPL